MNNQASTQPPLIKRMKPLLGTFTEITLKNSTDCQQQFQAAFNAIETIEKQMSFHNPASALSLLNKAPGDWVTLPKETLTVLTLAKQLGEQSHELFNCTVGGFLVKNKHLPNHFTHCFDLSGNSGDIEVKEDKARLLKPVLITLDGIAKGYAIDFAIATIKAKGVKSAMINAGGDMRAIGEISHPIQRRNIADVKSIEPLLELKNQALATSQVNQQINKDLPSYIVNSEGLKPMDCIISVTAKETWLADALTKILALLPRDQRTTIAKHFSARYHP